jgi:hypothetical protein
MAHEINSLLPEIFMDGELWYLSHDRVIITFPAHDFKCCSLPPYLRLDFAINHFITGLEGGSLHLHTVSSKGPLPFHGTY